APAAAERLCRRRRCWRRLPLLTAAPFSSPRPRRGGRACARSCVRSFRGAPTRRVPGREGQTEAGARRDTALGQSRLPRAAQRSGCGEVAGGGCPRPAEEVAPTSHWAPRGWGRPGRLQSPRLGRDAPLFCVRGCGCGILSLGVGLPSCPGDGMWRVYSCSWWGWQWQGRPRSMPASSMGPSSLGGSGSREGPSGNLKSELAFVLSGPFLSFASLSLLPHLGTKASHSLDSLTVRTPLRLLITCG
ncbi:LOW QUALITY PROTEIN: uncharacterized protein LOC125098074, partial [Lutra lutra]|uniref:LOW QUALITY PROTEIN: uncharacterized protein LOC125098074 n=1 Tax=Lutra lutra TaxID=9657 RepID=UPI001FCFFA53